MTDFINVEMDDGTTIAFEAPSGSDGGFEKTGLHGGTRAPESSLTRLKSVSSSLAEIASALRSDLAPDELSLDVTIGIEAEVGWFFARSKGSGSISVHVTWKRKGDE